MCFVIIIIKITIITPLMPCTGNMFHFLAKNQDFIVQK